MQYLLRRFSAGLGRIQTDFRLKRQLELFVWVLGLGVAPAMANLPINVTPVPAKIQPSTLAEDWHRGAFMEIFVRGYSDSDGDGIGDLKGLTSKLDYLKDLGVKGIWLMPITASADGDHGYATTDYRSVEPAYGTLADFDTLIEEAHARGIGVIMDYVINHSASSHPLFLEAQTGPKSPYYDWFVWEPVAPSGWDIWGKNPWTQTGQGAYFGTFGPHMPDFNFKNPAVLAYHQDNLRFWLNRGLDGFRLDAVPHLVETNAKDWNDQPESRRITAELRELITAYPKRYVVCEATAEPQVYAHPKLCGSAFAFGLERHLAQAAAGDTRAMSAIAQYFKVAPYSMASFASNHDLFAGQRLWDQVSGDSDRYKLAAATYLLLPGTPFIYYGEEIGMGAVRGLQGDEPLRTPMSWAPDAVRGGFTSGKPFRPIAPNVMQQHVGQQVGDPRSIHAFYKRVLNLRNRYPALSRGSYEFPFVRGQVFGFQRSLGNEKVVVLINYGLRSAQLGVSDLGPRRTLTSADLPDQTLRTDSRGRVQVRIPAQSLRVFLVKS